jgi:hypothetical protein
MRMKKKRVVVFLAFLWGACASNQPLVLPVLSSELDILVEELQDLSDDFFEGQLVADASEKKMNLVIVPFFNWFSGIATTNKKKPETLTAEQITDYNRLFLKYTKVYGPDDELYEYYNFGKVFLTLVDAANAMKNDLSVLGIKEVNDSSVTKLSPSNVQHVLAYTAALTAYTDFLERASKGFKKPFSLSLPTLYKDITSCVEKIISLKDQIGGAHTLSLPSVPVKSAYEIAMDGIVEPLYSDLSGKGTGEIDKLTSTQVDAYTTQFALYESQEGTGAGQYVYYKFGSLFLPLLVAKNVFENDLLGMNVTDPDDIQDSEVTAVIKKDAQVFLDTYKKFNAFITTVSSTTVLPVSADVYKNYEELVPYASKVVALQQSVAPVQPPIQPQISADSFILNNFGDSKLSALSFGEVQTLLAQFSNTFASSDSFSSEYQMWAAYVPTRYWELQLLAGNTGAATAFTATYLNTFKSAYANNSLKVRETYKTQLNDIALEFSISYALARVKLHSMSNNLYS